MHADLTAETSALAYGGSRSGWLIAGALTSLIILIPIGTIAAYLFAPPSENWAHLVDTVLPEYVRNSLWLMAGVSLGAGSIGVTTAWLTSMYRFPGRNILIWALLLVAIIGPGILAGIVAIGLRSIGFIAKLLYESIEEIDENQVEAVTATGASRAQIVDFAIVPQVLPTFFGVAVFRWDINIRESTGLGLVGAGGIGLQLQASLNILAWPQVTLILIAIFLTVMISEWVSARVRHAVI